MLTHDVEARAAAATETYPPETSARTLRIDKLLRRFDLYSIARDAVDVQDEATMRKLRAYAAGVNARLEEIKARPRGRIGARLP